MSGGEGCWCVATGVGIASGGSACLGGGGVQERLLLVPAPPPALKRQAARVSGGEGCWCVAAGVGIAIGGSACLGGERRARKTSTCSCFADGVEKTGGGRVVRRMVLVCCRRCRYCRRWHMASEVAGMVDDHL